MPGNEKDRDLPRSAAAGWKWLVIDFLAPLTGAIALSAWLSASARELGWQRGFFDTESGEWLRGEGSLWRFLYEFASLPVLLTCVAAVVVLIGRFRWPALRRWRRVAWFALSLLFLGPGLVVNLWMKDRWGRPRPRELVEFGGRAEYESVFALDFTGLGKSFPCGHATMGFYFLGAWLLLRRRYPRWGVAALAASLIWGGLIGYARMVQGGHFASDVVWAAAVMWILAAALFRVFGLRHRVLDPPPRADSDEAGRAVPLAAKLAGGLVIAALIGAISLATPYREKREIMPMEESAETARVKGSLTIVLGDIDIVPAPVVRIDGEARGHGVPTSAITGHWEEATEADGLWRFKYFQRNSGRFSEIHQRLTIGIPWERVDFLKIDLGPGRTRMRLPRIPGEAKIKLILRGTDLVLEPDPGARLWFDPRYPADARDESGGAVVLGGETSGGDPPGHSLYRFAVERREGGSVLIRGSEGK